MENKYEIKIDTVITISKGGKLETIHFLDQKTHHVVAYEVKQMGFEDVEKSLKNLANVSLLNVGVDFAKEKDTQVEQVISLDNK